MNVKEFIENVGPERCEEMEFKRLTSEFASVLLDFGISIRPYSINGKINFNKCSLKKKREVIA